MRSLICFWYRFVFEEFGKLETKSYLTHRGRHMPKLTKTEMLISAYEKCELLTISLHVYLYLFFFFFFGHFALVGCFCSLSPFYEREFEFNQMNYDCQWSELRDDQFGPRLPM